MSRLTIVFVGDSVTDCGRRTDEDGLGDGYVRELSAHPARARWRVVNRGESGDRARDLVTRWDADVLAESPDVVSIFVGINEVWRRFDSDDATTDERFEAEYRGLLDTLAGETFVAACEAMQDAGDAAAVAPDGVHPNDAGHRVLADAWMAAAGRVLAD